MNRHSCISFQHSSCGKRVQRIHKFPRCDTRCEAQLLGSGFFTKRARGDVMLSMREWIKRERERERESESEESEWRVRVREKETERDGETARQRELTKS